MFRSRQGLLELHLTIAAAIVFAATGPGCGNDSNPATDEPTTSPSAGGGGGQTSTTSLGGQSAVGGQTSQGGSTAVGGYGGWSAAGGQGQGGSGQGGNDSGCLPLNGTVLAMDKLYLGDKDLTDVANPNAWKQFGFDLDSLSTTTANLSGHCQPAEGADSSMLNDGDNGKDNAFGRNVLPILAGLAPDISTEVNTSLNGGEFSLLALFEQLGPGADQDRLVTRLYGGAPFSGYPLWNGTDCWSVAQEQLNDPSDINSAQTIFTTASLQNNEWSSGSLGTVVIPLRVIGLEVPMTIKHARLSLKLNPDHLGAVQGQLGGVVDTELFVEGVRDVLGTFDLSFCQSDVFDSFALEIRRSSDIMTDGSQNENDTCNGISIGLGFTMTAAGLAGIAAPAPPPPNPCP